MTTENWVEYKQLLIQGRAENRELMNRLADRIEKLEVTTAVIKTKITIAQVGLGIVLTAVGGILVKLFGG